eukprot:6460418-Amphidinium_carterae.1
MGCVTRVRSHFSAMQLASRHTTTRFALHGICWPQKKHSRPARIAPLNKSRSAVVTSSDRDSAVWHRKPSALGHRAR